MVRPTLFRTRFDRALAGVVVGGLFLQGIPELLFRLEDPMPLLFWLPTLWGGAACVLVGSFRVNRTERFSKTLVILGAGLGFLPSAWTVLMPILIVVLVVRTVMTSHAA